MQNKCTPNPRIWSWIFCRGFFRRVRGCILRRVRGCVLPYTTVSRESQVATLFSLLATNNDQRHPKRDPEGTVATSLASGKMDDHSTETLNRLAEAHTRDRLLGGQDLYLDENSISLISNHIDCFVSQSRGNESIEEVIFYPRTFNGHDDDLWNKLGQAVGNLQSLKRLRIQAPDYDDEVVQIPDWEILASILKYVRRRITVDFDDVVSWSAEKFKMFARVIHGHPSIYSFEGGRMIPFESMDTFYSALATLPALESVKLSNRGLQRSRDRSTLASTESLTELLRVPSLRSVNFCGFSFTPALFQATANALMEGTAITNLEFNSCSFATEVNTAMMTKGFSKNTSVTCIDIMSPRDGTLCNALAAALPSNSTLRRLGLELDRRNNDDDRDSFSRFLSALGHNTGLKTLIVQGSYSMNESLCTAMQNGLGMNATLESLELKRAPLYDDNADLWCRAFSFLRTNKALKSLTVDMLYSPVTCHSAFRIDIAAMLQDNASLESISIQSTTRIEAEDYLAFITALQGNTSLKTLILQYERLGSPVKLQLTDDEDKRIASLLKNNYGLEFLPSIYLEAGDVGAILRLNSAGRRYLIEDGSSISKGVEVLSRVHNDTNCVFLHLLENPRLCDRSAVEKVSVGESNSSSTNPTAGSDGGKRERASVREGQASHRRLA
jgi:hypothetical protein